MDRRRHRQRVGVPGRSLENPHQKTKNYPNVLCWDNRQDLPPEFASHFTFVPAATATYNMTAVFAFHGIYVLRCDDSWWICRDSGVRLKIQ
jgi:hypothetical protein